MKVVRLSALRTGRLYRPGNIPGTHFCYRLNRPQNHSPAGRIKSMKNHKDPIGNGISDLPGCSAVPQPTAPLRPPLPPYLWTRKIWKWNLFIRPHLIKRYVRCILSTRWYGFNTLPPPPAMQCSATDPNIHAFSRQCIKWNLPLSAFSMPEAYITAYWSVVTVSQSPRRLVPSQFAVPTCLQLVSEIPSLALTAVLAVPLNWPCCNSSQRAVTELVRVMWLH